MKEIPALAPIDMAKTGATHDKFIVCLKSQYGLKSHVDWVRQQRNSSLDSNYVCAVTHEYEIVKDYHAKLRGSALYNPTSHPEVDCIIQDRRCTLDASPLANINVPGVLRRHNAPWDLDRLSRLGPLPTNASPQALNHQYHSQLVLDAANNPVDAYVLGFNFTDGIDGDAHGHGTHLARTPAQIPGTLAVGASTINDERAEFSNYGPRVGIFAPGECIISAAIASPSSSIPKSGTSMAAPLVVGTIAYLIQREGNRAPAAMINRLEELAHHGALVGNLPNGTRNLLINNGVL
ncbi:hypothetical protein RSOLAG22IIIB_11707 [Rhizoctonia solani]|uniref:Peptidase S8/S53 domain-containing protein n=1 Tax=Rhizoctonia solani TaxID=456999 RepID=A0A0K6G9T5_9AGAM|nr:hypothetical protein RSOLAG22IIIB_11707 [Rhizoctonia solani]